MSYGLVVFNGLCAEQQIFVYRTDQGYHGYNSSGQMISGTVTTVPIEGVSPGGNTSAQTMEAKFREEINKLKGDKLELLRQNMSAKSELKTLRDRETQLQNSLSMASREIQRLNRSRQSSEASTLTQ